MEYQDFVIELTTLTAGTHQVNVIDTPAGQTRQPLALGLSDEALRDKLAQIEQTLRYKESLTMAEKRDQLMAVKAFGGSLFEALINDNLKALYDQSRFITRQQDQGLRLKLRIDSSLLAAVPWELLYDARFDEFVGTSRQVSMVRYVALPRPAQLLATKPPLNVLGVVAAPSNLPPLDVAFEKQQVETALRPLINKGLASLTWLETPNWRALLRAMKNGPWHVLHYVGHSDFDADADEGHLCLVGEDGREERLTAGSLSTLLADHGTLRLVLLNSCQGARIGQDVYSSIATTLVRRGIPAVIGMQYDVSDEAALELALTFYETLAENVSIETALSEARKAISLAVNESAEWGTPVLYTHAPDSVLFDMQTTPPVVDRAVLDHLAESTTRSVMATEQVDELVGTVRRLAPKLKSHPDQAAYAALVVALDEVAKTWQVTNDALEEIWQLYKANGDLKEVSEGLLDIGDYQLQAKVEMGRGHCHIIGDIYSRHLSDWFAQTLAGDDLTAVENLFITLGNADADVFQDMVRVAAQIEAAANQVLNLVEDDRADEARTVAKELRRTLSPLRTAVNRSLVVLKQLRVEFAGISAGEQMGAAGVAAVAGADSAVENAPVVDQTYLTTVYELLRAHFDESELRTLCFYLGIDYESLVGVARPGKARALVQYCQRAGRLADLREIVMRERPRVSWPELPQSPSSGMLPEADTDLDTWVETLKTCATMNNRDRRDDVVRDLPPFIQGNIQRRAALYDDVYNIARTCMEYNDGMAALVAAIKKREGPSVYVQKLETFL